MNSKRVTHKAIVNRIRATRINICLLAGIVTIIAAGPSTAQENLPPFNNRPAVAHVVLSNSPKKYDGTYSLSEVARVCGEVPGELNFSGVPAFGVTLYPESGRAEVNDVTFDSKELVGGATTSETFFLSVIVQSPTIGSPPAYVLDTSKPDVSGRAELSYPEPGTLKLTVHGADELGQTIQLELTCMPRS